LKDRRFAEEHRARRQLADLREISPGLFG
jgi:hypothetical protein